MALCKLLRDGSAERNASEWLWWSGEWMMVQSTSFFYSFTITSFNNKFLSSFQMVQAIQVLRFHLLELEKVSG